MVAKLTATRRGLARYHDRQVDCVGTVERVSTPRAGGVALLLLDLRLRRDGGDIPVADHLWVRGIQIDRLVGRYALDAGDRVYFRGWVNRYPRAGGRWEYGVAEPTRVRCPRASNRATKERLRRACLRRGLEVWAA